MNVEFTWIHFIWFFCTCFAIFTFPNGKLHIKQNKNQGLMCISNRTCKCLMWCQRSHPTFCRVQKKFDICSLRKIKNTIGRWKQTRCINNIWVVVSFAFFMFIPIWGKWTHFDYFSDGLVQPPTWDSCIGFFFKIGVLFRTKSQPAVGSREKQQHAAWMVQQPGLSPIALPRTLLSDVQHFTLGQNIVQWDRLKSFQIIHWLKWI